MGRRFGGFVVAGAVAVAGCGDSGPASPISAGLAERRFVAISESQIGQTLNVPHESGRAFDIVDCSGMAAFGEDGAVGTNFGDRDEFFGVVESNEVEESVYDERRTVLSELVAYAAAVCPDTAEAIAVEVDRTYRGLAIVNGGASRPAETLPTPAFARTMLEVADDNVGRGDWALRVEVGSVR